MTTRPPAASLALLLVTLFVPAALNRARAVERFFCQKTHFLMPKNPCIRYKCICPKPNCPHCPIENYGYFPTCWQRWEFPPYYCHCPVPPITLNAPQSTLDTPAASAKTEELPLPAKETPETTPPEKTTPEKTTPEPTLP